MTERPGMTKASQELACQMIIDRRPVAEIASEIQVTEATIEKWYGPDAPPWIQQIKMELAARRAEPRYFYYGLAGQLRQKAIDTWTETIEQREDPALAYKASSDWITKVDLQLIAPDMPMKQTVTDVHTVHRDSGEALQALQAIRDIAQNIKEISAASPTADPHVHTGSNALARYGPTPNPSPEDMGVIDLDA